MCTGYFTDVVSNISCQAGILLLIRFYQRRHSVIFMWQEERNGYLQIRSERNTNFRSSFLPATIKVWWTWTKYDIQIDFIQSLVWTNQYILERKWTQKLFKRRSELLWLINGHCMYNNYHVLYPVFAQSVKSQHVHTPRMQCFPLMIMYK